MKAIKKLGQGVLVAIGVLGLAGTVSAAPQAITTCKSITVSGPYVLTKNLTAAGDCLVVKASNVTIDLGGYVLTGNGTGRGVFADVGFGFRGIVVRNGVVTGFAHGVLLGGFNHVVDDVRVFDMTGSGIYVGDGSLVKGSVASDNGDFGIWLVCPASAIGNTAVGNGFPNLFQNGAGCVLSQNLAP